MPAAASAYHRRNRTPKSAAGPVTDKAVKKSVPMMPAMPPTGSMGATPKAGMGMATSSYKTAKK